MINAYTSRPRTKLWTDNQFVQVRMNTSREPSETTLFLGNASIESEMTFFNRASFLASFWDTVSSERQVFLNSTFTTPSINYSRRWESATLHIWQANLTSYYRAWRKSLAFSSDTESFFLVVDMQGLRYGRAKVQHRDHHLPVDQEQNFE